MDFIKNNNIKSLLAGVLLTSISGLSTANAEKHTINIEHVFNYPAEVVWHHIGSFCSIKYWQSLVQDCVVSEKKDGIYRFVTMKDHTVFTERLESYSNTDMQFSYSIKHGPIELDNYLSVLTVIPTKEKHSKLLWKVTFNANKNSNIKSSLSALFQNGISGMDILLKNNSKESEQ